MEKDKIKDAILKTAGYPQSGVIAEMADAMAEAIANLGKPMETKKFEKKVKPKVSFANKTNTKKKKFSFSNKKTKTKKM